MLILGLSFLISFKILWASSIFLVKKSEKLFLMLFLEAWAYECSLEESEDDEEVKKLTLSL